MTRDAAAVIVAGGQGKRFGGKIRKQYLQLSGRPVLWWSLHAFDQSPSIGLMMVVVPEADLLRVRRESLQWGLRKPVFAVAGGETRADSVRQGLQALPPEFRYVAVHDAVRPLVTTDLIEAVLKTARQHRAAIAAIPSKDTVKVAGPGQTIRHTLPRETVWLAQTPQVFERKLLEKAHRLSPRRKPGSRPLDSGLRRNDGVTDDSMMVERLGVRVKLVAAFPENLKVTVPADFEVAKAVIARRNDEANPLFVRGVASLAKNKKRKGARSQ